MEEEHCDLCIVGGGYASMNALDAASTYLPEKSRVVIVGKGSRWGGHWVEEYAFVKLHEERLQRLSANFAVAADLALLLGGRLKFEEMFMGRLADAIGAVFLGYGCLHHYARNHDKVDGTPNYPNHS